MGRLEAGTAVIRGHIVEGFSMPFPRDEYYETVFLPGFSDGHAHPQVIDGGLEPGLKWSNSYEWLATRMLHVNEADLRADIGLSAELAKLVMKRAVLEGTTLIALTGKFEANLKARVSMRYGPRVVLLPTVMRRRGWASPIDLEAAFEKYSRFINDNLLRIGIFVHSVAYAAPEMLRESLRMARQRRIPLGIHLSEGISEREDFLRASEAELNNTRIIAVHCINDNYLDLGLKCVGCPGSNMLLYDKTRTSLEGVTSFGSDWPHLIGTVGSHISILAKLYAPDTRGMLYRATVGGYLDYSFPAKGDLVAYDEPLNVILDGRVRPKLVSVAGEIVVSEGRLVETGESYDDVLQDTLDVIKYAVEIHGDGVMPFMPSIEELERVLERIRGRRGDSAGSSKRVEVAGVGFHN